MTSDVKLHADGNLELTIVNEDSTMTLKKPQMTLTMSVAVSRTARAARALICALAFGLSAGAAHAQTPFYRATVQELAGPPGTIIRSEPMLFAPAGAQAYRVLYRSTGVSGERIAVSGVIVVPPGPAPAGGRRIVAWAHPTTGVGP